MERRSLPAFAYSAYSAVEDFSFEIFHGATMRPTINHADRSGKFALPEIMFPAGTSEAAIANQLVALFIPKPEGEGFEAGEQRDGLHALKQGLRFVALLEVIIRDARAQMMNVMKPNVAGEPL